METTDKLQVELEAVKIDKELKGDKATNKVVAEVKQERIKEILQEDHNKEILE